ncbi:hypothetical protein PoB_003564000 [Plakobranchus ocellatus]|uniref:Uncharacterized protein n=1 Tax=Plakobranchus ocellatus TaxID=259542 RepID=A0AAV4AQI2_9GAST|nr:hypothetical protein PoB_003564000 [Plakobranchus ocellatus]
MTETSWGNTVMGGRGCEKVTAITACYLSRNSFNGYGLVARKAYIDETIQGYDDFTSTNFVAIFVDAAKYKERIYSTANLLLCSHSSGSEMDRPTTRRLETTVCPHRWDACAWGSVWAFPASAGPISVSSSQSSNENTRSELTNQTSCSPYILAEQAIIEVCTGLLDATFEVSLSIPAFRLDSTMVLITSPPPKGPFYGQVL